MQEVPAELSALYLERVLLEREQKSSPSATERIHAIDRRIDDLWTTSVASARIVAPASTVTR